MKKLLLSTILIATAIFHGNLTMAQDAAGIAPPVISEIMYNPPEVGNDSLEFIEIFNPDLTSAINMSGFYIADAFNFTFPDGFFLGAGDHVLITGDSVIFENTFGVEALEWAGATTQLSNSGESITLRDASGFVLDSVFYRTTVAWPQEANGDGYSLVLCDPTADNSLAESWTLSENATGVIITTTAGPVEIFADPGATSTCTPTGVSEMEETSVFVFPNPSNGDFRLQMDALDETAQVRIFNAMGQMVFSEAVAAGTTAVDLTTGLKSGHYILSVENGETLQRMKLIVQ